MYITRVILCLFSALSRNVGALQISIIVIMETDAPEIFSVVNVDAISAGGINLLLSLSSKDSLLVLEVVMRMAAKPAYTLTSYRLGKRDSHLPEQRKHG